MSFKLENKNIVIFSSQSWGEMLLSKHHYAIELAAKKNKVYFINIPKNNFECVSINSSRYPNLFLVNSGIWNINKLRFHSKPLFKLLININIKRIIKKINCKIDIVWNFDFLGYCNYKYFENSLKIAHPVDFIKPENQVLVQGSDVIFSVAYEILDEVNHYKIPSFFINHGIHEEFLNYHLIDKKSEKIKVGYIGNLLRFDIDHNLIQQLISSNPEVEFTFIGNYKPSNISSGYSKESLNFIEFLKNKKNVCLLGALPKKEMIKKMTEQDIFLILYHPKKDNCRGTNYHKVLEYLAIGRTIISHPISTYSNTGLIETPTEEKSINQVFNDVLNNLIYFNSNEKIKKRKEFAKQNTYYKQIEKIESKLNQIIGQ